ncbi:beta-propeller fold lactonase family protein [Aquabacterium sp.]|uniref:beta-propeller fold lactonase family protein n=1 Tax=Aquabacterium sp. TaxID=1872578 RepID=UPI0025C33987|nr:beta-propeller fold lactonase family protein [Aquabacterium sp.]
MPTLRPHRPRLRPTAWLAASFLAAASLSWSAVQAAPDRSAHAYISLQDGGVAVLDLATLAPAAEIPLQGKGPRGLGVTNDGHRLVVAVRESGDVQIVDLDKRLVVQRIPVGKNPEFVRVRGHLAFVSFEPSSTGGPPPKPGEAGAKPPHDDDDDKEPAQIAVIDLDQGKVLRRIVGGAETEGIEITPDGRRIVVTNEADHNITVHDVRTGKRLQTIDIQKYGDRPRGIKLSPDGQTYAVTLEFGNKVLLLDSHFKPLRTLDTGAFPYGVAFDRSGDRLFVAAARANLLQVFDARRFTKLADIPVGERCWHFTFTPDDARLLVSCGRSKETLVIDAKTYAPLQKIPTPGTPWGVLTWPKSMGSLDQP